MCHPDQRMGAGKKLCEPKGKKKKETNRGIHIVSFKSFIHKIVWHPAEILDLSLGSEPPTSLLKREGIFAKTGQKHTAVLMFRDSHNSGSGLAASVKLTASSLVHP